MEIKKIEKKNCEEVAEVLKVLSHPQRLYILCHLIHNELSVKEIEEICNTSQSLISQHLARMRLEGILKSKRRGKQIYYKIANKKVKKLLEEMYKIFCASCDD